jgi:polyisoprenoid-binding protein YceI
MGTGAGTTEPIVGRGTWKLDPARANVEFVGAHTGGIGRVRGQFTEVEGAIAAADDVAPTATTTIGAASLGTDNKRRDADLRSAAFLDVEAHPEIQYAASTIEPIGEGRYVARGTLTVKGTTSPLDLNVEVTSREGDEVQLRADGQFDRRDLGIRLGLKSLLVARRVRVQIDAVLVRSGE